MSILWIETLQSLLSLNNKSYPGKRKDMWFPGFLTLFDNKILTLEFLKILMQLSRKMV